MDRKTFDQTKNVFGLEIIEVYVLVKNSNRKVLMRLNKFDQLAVVKQNIKIKLQIDSSDINLLTKGKILKGDHKILKDFKIEPKQVKE